MPRVEEISFQLAWLILSLQTDCDRYVTGRIWLVQQRPPPGNGQRRNSSLGVVHTVGVREVFTNAPSVDSFLACHTFSFVAQASSVAWSCQVFF